MYVLMTCFSGILDFLFNGTNPFPETCPTSATTQEETVTTPTTAGPLPAQGSKLSLPAVCLLICIYVSVHRIFHTPS